MLCRRMIFVLLVLCTGVLYMGVGRAVVWTCEKTMGAASATGEHLGFQRRFHLGEDLLISLAKFVAKGTDFVELLRGHGCCGNGAGVATLS